VEHDYHCTAHSATSRAGTLLPNPGFRWVRVTGFLALCVCFVDRCLFFCTFIIWPLCVPSFASVGDLGFDPVPGKLNYYNPDICCLQILSIIKIIITESKMTIIWYMHMKLSDTNPDTCNLNIIMCKWHYTLTICAWISCSAVTPVIHTWQPCTGTAILTRSGITKSYISTGWYIVYSSSKTYT
jgi:hypothetical protein